ncbi:hypothetical protein [uncultured Enterococcus sp.]|uniref:hypothetical protein n=1 Tax=uncultured Enterococcus sp. TaxID=167972 RepID=UPI0025F98AD6|nr:hypothetical protein [uncultured Enterococcus sp.]
MFYSGMALLFLAIVSLIWLIAAFVRKTNKKIPGIVFALSLIGFLIIVTITGTTSEPANQNTTPSELLSDSSSSSATTSQTESEIAKKNDEKLKAEFDIHNDGNYVDATGAEVITNDDGSIKYVQLNVNSNWKYLSEDEQKQYIQLLKDISDPFKDGETYPYMQIQSEGELVAVSGVQDTSLVTIKKE